MLRCPKCGSDKVRQFRSLIGRIWCGDCGYAIEHKERDDSFIVKPSPTRKERALDCCVELFKDYTREEINNYSGSIISAWKIGKYEVMNANL